MHERSHLRFVLEGIEGVACLGAAVLSWPFAGRWLRNWGSRRSERERRWLGDDLVSSHDRETTRAITIEASARSIWARVVQLGLGRAGFYSYELLERIGGLRVTNVESVEAKWQSLAVGDEVVLYPRVGVRVARISEGEYVCFGKRTSLGEDVEDLSWSFYVVPSSGEACRLVVRSCLAPLPDRSLRRRVLAGLEAALDFVMEQRMLRTIKRLSRGPRQHAPEVRDTV